jgi:hypothetical protein
MEAEMNPCFALFDPSGKMRRCSETLDGATNFFPKKEYSTEMWNALFGAKAEDRARIFGKNGWTVTSGVFVPKKK